MVHNLWAISDDLRIFFQFFPISPVLRWILRFCSELIYSLNILRIRFRVQFREFSMVIDFPFPFSAVRSYGIDFCPLCLPDIPHLRVDWEMRTFFVESRKGWINRKHHFLRFDDETLEISEFLWSAQNRKINRSNRSYPSSETYLFRAHLNCNITAKINNSHFNLKSPFSPSKTIKRR